MFLYKCRSIKNSGEIREYFCFAKSKDDVLKISQKSRETLISCSVKKHTTGAGISSVSLPFFKSLDPLLSNSIDLISALKIIATSKENIIINAIAENMIYSISRGSSFSKAMACFGDYFDDVVIKSIEASEKTASMPRAVKGIIEYLEEKDSLHTKIKNTIRYPILLVFSMFAMLLFWIFVIVPTFAEIFADIGIDPPFITKVLMSIRGFCIGNAVYLLLLFAVLVFYIVKIIRKNKNDGFVRFLPFYRNFKNDWIIYRFFSIMSVLLQEKIQIIDALNCALSGEKSQKLSLMIQNIKKGIPISMSMQNTGMFSDVEVSLIRSGENSGDLARVFKTSEMLIKTKISNKLDKIISLIQPVAILFTGLMLVAIVYSVIIPIYSYIG